MTVRLLWVETALIMPCFHKEAFWGAGHGTKSNYSSVKIKTESRWISRRQTMTKHDHPGLKRWAMRNGIPTAFDQCTWNKAFSCRKNMTIFHVNTWIQPQRFKSSWGGKGTSERHQSQRQNNNRQFCRALEHTLRMQRFDLLTNTSRKRHVWQWSPHKINAKAKGKHRLETTSKLSRELWQRFMESRKSKNESSCSRTCEAWDWKGWKYG